MACILRTVDSFSPSGSQARGIRQQVLHTSGQDDLLAEIQPAIRIYRSEVPVVTFGYDRGDGTIHHRHRRVHRYLFSGQGSEFRWNCAISGNNVVHFLGGCIALEIPLVHDSILKADGSPYDRRHCR